jgi:Raf kinase inhibitor-like YbhB/YbcL family protein
MRIVATIAAAATAGCGAQEESSSSMKLTSSAFADHEAIPARFTCEGANVSPPLQWSDPPDGTRSFALVVDDPDAPGATFSHWGLFGLASDRRGLDEAAGKAGATGFRQARNDFGRAEYGGPCPPRGRGPHRYQFRLLALDVAGLELGADPRIREVEQKAKDHTLATALLTGLFERR